jgi:predicted sulfurtransferase
MGFVRAATRALIQSHAPSQVCRLHRAALNGLDIRGRIYISAQGINAQYSGPADDACQYARWVEVQLEFQVEPIDEVPAAASVQNASRGPQLLSSSCLAAFG